MFVSYKESYVVVCFFFQAEDVIRDLLVTGVQTCALPISAITETVGWGGFVLGGAPGILSLVGGTPEEALNYSREMKKITVATHPTYRMPALGFVGASIGIDIRLVVQTNTTPIIDTAIAHKDPGYPKIGSGVLRAPAECFKKALTAFGKHYAAR